MSRALYYPHTRVDNPSIIKNALLLWDSLETIVPRQQRGPRSTPSREIEEASEIIVKARRPSGAERQVAHDELGKLLDTGLIQRLVADSPSHVARRQYRVYPDKFLMGTWNQLEARGLALLDDGDFDVPPALGFLMMSLLADACAGTQILKVTDRVDAYSWLTQARAAVLGEQHVVGLDISQVAPAYDRLVTLSIKALDARRISMKKLIELRKKEERSGGSGLKHLRQNYAKAVSSHVMRIGKEAKSLIDLKELEAQFIEELERDLGELKSELGLASLKTLLSKEVAASAVIAGGCLISPIAGLTELASSVGLIGVVPLLKASVELRAARKVALQKHATSWLYLANQGPISLR